MVLRDCEHVISTCGLIELCGSPIVAVSPLPGPGPPGACVSSEAPAAG